MQLLFKRNYVIQVIWLISMEFFVNPVEEIIFKQVLFGCNFSYSNIEMYQNKRVYLIKHTTFEVASYDLVSGMFSSNNRWYLEVTVSQWGLPQFNLCTCAYRRNEVASIHDSRTHYQPFFLLLSNFFICIATSQSVILSIMRLFLPSLANPSNLRM